jgi:hypothetical protein
MPTFTPDSELDLLFSPELIPTEVKAQLGSDLHVRFFHLPQKLKKDSHRENRYARLREMITLAHTYPSFPS